MKPPSGELPEIKTECKSRSLVKAEYFLQVGELWNSFFQPKPALFFSLFSLVLMAAVVLNSDLELVQFFIRDLRRGISRFWQTGKTQRRKEKLFLSPVELCVISNHQ